MIVNIVIAGVEARQARVAQWALERLSIDAIVGGDSENAWQALNRAVDRELIPHLGNDLRVEVQLNQRIGLIRSQKAGFFVTVGLLEAHLTPEESAGLN